MIPRILRPILLQRLEQFPAVALLGPRQVGKTTLALQLAEVYGALYLDLESPSDRARLADPEAYLKSVENRLVILDEVQCLPELFGVLRGVIDARRRSGKRAAQFLLLGSASVDLIRQSSETLAGRIAYLELEPLCSLEVAPAQQNQLWVRGGFPDSFLAPDDVVSRLWREAFVRTYLEREIPQLGPRLPAETLRRFWTMLAHEQGGLFNASRLARGLGVSGTTVARYLDLLVDLLLVRRLPPLHANVGKRLVRSPRVYLRDSGLVHTLLGLDDWHAVLGHPVAGGSWEGFVIENLLRASSRAPVASFYRTAGGAEIDLVLDFPGGERWAVEVKRSSTPRLERGFYQGRADLEPDRSFVVHPGADRWPMGDGVEAISLQELCADLSN